MRDIINKLEKINILEAKAPKDVISVSKDSSVSDIKASIKYNKYMRAKMDTDKARATYDKDIAQLEGWLEAKKKNESIVKEDLADMAHEAEKDHEVQMARSDLYKSAKYAVAIHKMMKDIPEMEGIDDWVAANITKAADYLSSVKHHMEGQMMADVELAVVPVAGDMTDAMDVPQENIEEVHEKADIKEDDTDYHRVRIHQTEKDEITDILIKYPAETNKFQQNGDINSVYDTELYQELFNYFQDDMPYDTQKGRDGDPVQFINDALDEYGLMDEKIVGEDAINDIIKNLPKDKMSPQQSQQDMISSIIAKLPRDDAEKGIDGPANAATATPKTNPVTQQKMQNKMALPKAKPIGRDPYGADKTASFSTMATWGKK